MGPDPPLLLPQKKEEISGKPGAFFASSQPDGIFLSTHVCFYLPNKIAGEPPPPPVDSEHGGLFASTRKHSSVFGGAFLRRGSSAGVSDAEGADGAEGRPHHPHRHGGFVRFGPGREAAKGAAGGDGVPRKKVKSRRSLHWKDRRSKLDLKKGRLFASIYERVVFVSILRLLLGLWRRELRCQHEPERGQTFSSVYFFLGSLVVLSSLPFFGPSMQPVVLREHDHVPGPSVRVSPVPKDRTARI